MTNIGLEYPKNKYEIEVSKARFLCSKDASKFKEQFISINGHYRDIIAGRVPMAGYWIYYQTNFDFLSTHLKAINHRRSLQLPFLN